MKEIKKPDFLANLTEDAREKLSAGMQQAKDLHSNGASGRKVVEKITSLMDEVVLDVWRGCWMNIAGLDPEHTPASLVAVGGFGRGEMNPYSDLDLLIFHSQKGGRWKSVYDECVEVFIRTLWDLKLDLGATTRNESECVKLAAEDSKVKTALIDARILASNMDLAEIFKRTLEKRILTDEPRKFIEEKTKEIKSRRRKYGDSIYLLEPHVKEGEGGLRDIHTALWIAKVTYKTHQRRVLLLQGALTNKEYNALDERLDFVFRIRNEMHFAAGRIEDRLTFDIQEKIAEFFGYTPAQDRLPVELFMKDYYLNADAISGFADKLIERCTGVEFKSRNSAGKSRSLWGRKKKHSIGNGFQLAGGQISAIDLEEISENPINVMHAFIKLSTLHATLSPSLKEFITKNADKLGSEISTDKEAAGCFKSILGSERAALTLESMHETGFLGAYIPEFEALRRQVQHDAYHIYTTDIHSLFTFMELKQFVDDEADERFAHLIRVAGELDDSYILLLAGLFHDIGKGLGKKHSIRGAKIVEKIGERFQLRDDETKELRFLVRNHLIMAEISQKRDLTDEVFIAKLAKTIGSESILKKLYLITAADMMAVGPDTFTEWKAGLLKELYEHALRLLEKGYEVMPIRNKVKKVFKRLRPMLEEALPRNRIDFNFKGMPARFYLSHTPEVLAQYIKLMESLEDKPLVTQVKTWPQKGFNEFVISTHDNPRVFSMIAGVLSSKNINIMSADIFTRSDGTVLDRFLVNSPNVGAIDDDRKWRVVEETLTQVLTGRLRVDKLVAELRKPSMLALKFKPKGRPPKIEVDNSSSDKFTIIEVYAPDRVGLLFDITHALSEMGLYIDLAIITTHVDQVADIFYVRDIFKHKITEESRIEGIKQELFNHLFESGKA